MRNDHPAKEFPIVYGPIEISCMLEMPNHGSEYLRLLAHRVPEVGECITIGRDTLKSLCHDENYQKIEEWIVDCVESEITCIGAPSEVSQFTDGAGRKRDNCWLVYTVRLKPA